MSEIKRQDIKKLNSRARLPKYFRGGAIGILILTVLIVGIGLYKAGNRPDFRLKPEHTKLSKEVVAEINGYERTETDGEIKKYYIKADKATTFSDNHQELENIYLQVFDETGDGFDTITAEKSLYIPAENKNFTAYFAGSVNIETRDGLKVKTEQLNYNKEDETAEAEELVEFERENIKGRSFGAFVRVKEKRLELMNQVEINAFALNPNDELAQNKLQTAKIKANYAMFDQLAEKIELNENVFINITPAPNNQNLQQPTDIKTNRATAIFINKEIKQIDLNGSVEVYQKPVANNPKWTRTKAEKAKALFEKELKRLELFDKVEIESTTDNSKPTKINSGYALYEKDSDRFDLKNGVHIVTIEDEKPTHIKSAEAVYEQTNGKIFLFGGGEIDNGTEYLKGDTITAQLNPNKKVKTADSKGNAYLKQTTTDQTTEISANELNALFNDEQALQKANALGNSRAEINPVEASEYSKVTLSAPIAIHVLFKGAGLLEKMQTEGRTTIQLNVPNNRPDAANKRLTADTVKTIFNANGKDLARAEAVGNGELYVEPLKSSAENYRTTITAPRFDCEFFPTGNNAKTCVASTKAKAVRVPTVQSENRGTQTLTADRLNADFNQQTHDIQQFDAVGNAKFNELDRHGTANQMTFTANDEVVKLRGEPIVWDSGARARAGEIDWDTRNQKSYLRGSVSTTYYSQKQTNGATPFGETNKPVYITAETAEFNHTEETGLYTGNARAWQENNFVRADKLLIQQKQGQLFGEGNVQSLLYNAKRKENGRETTSPAYASSEKLFYNRENRVLRYEGNVDIRQSTDRITAGVANIYLDENNEMSRTVAENSVIITSPNRRATGDWAEYSADNEVAILRGNPARIDDTQNGSTQGTQVTVNLRDNRFASEGKTNENSSGRTRSVYKIKKND